ncbi:MAG: retropepsin-like aspartic protease [Casimicrobiaceae bacterium]
MDTACGLICIPESVFQKLALAEEDSPEPQNVILANEQSVSVKVALGLRLALNGKEITVPAWVMGKDVVLGMFPLQALDLFIAPKDGYVDSRNDFLDHYKHK